MSPILMERLQELTFVEKEIVKACERDEDYAVIKSLCLAKKKKLQEFTVEAIRCGYSVPPAKSIKGALDLYLNGVSDDR